MNTNKIKNTEAKNLWQMPTSNKKRIVTPNYFNLIVALDKNEANLLNFLIKESSVYNTISYSTRLMIKYRAYIKAIERNFKQSEKKIIGRTNKTQPTNIHAVRDTFIKLIEKGLIFRVNKSEYLINFGLTYMVQYSASANKWTKQYNIISAGKLSEAVLWVINDQTLKEIRK